MNNEIDNETDNETDNEKSTIPHKILTVVGAVLCVILLPMLIINCTLLLKAWTNSDEVPSMFGYAPMVVMTDSMVGEGDGAISGGDLVVFKTVKAEEVKVGDVIAFFDPAGNGSSVTSHRVVGVTNDNGAISFTTKGDNNNVEDALPVPAENLIGIFTGVRSAGLGGLILFMQTTRGVILCVVVPILLLIGYDVVRRRIYEKQKQQDTDALLAELETLRAEKAKQEATTADSHDNNTTNHDCAS